MERRRFKQPGRAKRLDDGSTWFFDAGDTVLVRERRYDAKLVTFQYEGTRIDRGPYEAKWPEFDLCSEEIPRPRGADDTD